MFVIFVLTNVSSGSEKGQGKYAEITTSFSHPPPIISNRKTLFCAVDDFCRAAGPLWKGQLLSQNAGKARQFCIWWSHDHLIWFHQQWRAHVQGLLHNHVSVLLAYDFSGWSELPTLWVGCQCSAHGMSSLKWCFLVCFFGVMASWLNQPEILQSSQPSASGVWRDGSTWQNLSRLSSKFQTSRPVRQWAKKSRIA